ncbi:MAG TPA: 30S ribosomal protein S17 [Candidatus Woesebacteria bacterium]|nr:30S ribosomal protein S17 [Candidatus Woesebacteria bacterium]HRS23135.1 30S ribosomal protein S17 [Candidatus Woesebacteria bacterium]HRT39798.1 30S ribosomal protein S17 [Candidatus Woesebacteria bacterium]
MKNKKGKFFTGVVVSDKMEGTIVVELTTARTHPLYKKIIGSNKKVYVENNLKAKIGNRVKIRETRPLSKLKRFTTVAIVKN